ncbi:aminotransferase class IV [Psychrobacter sp. FDAARGOS_221]|uniref:aminotransferase class IV n=1 Tax=Psychrobacter sp. FDAARGOS_221 TaxID=1975705 RepID=UPI000BB58A5C|nr:aminotransferase class IV [Psychrobacter sp. FDAARGOS_221]PNK60622.1 branched-chain amino acid aminotransferase [Psychrobacter sp. FDAARGOS_221]
MIWYQLTDSGLLRLSQQGEQSQPLSETASHTADQTANQSTATIPITSPVAAEVIPQLRALAYGDGFFTTMGVHHGQLQWQTYHQQRLQHHCQALHLNYSSHTEQLLWSSAKQLAKEAKHGIVKVIVSRQSQPLRGYAYHPNVIHNGCLIWLGVAASALLAEQYASFLQSHTTQSALAQNVLQQVPITAICLQSQLASLPKPLAGLKSLNRLDGVMAAGELQRLKQIHPEVAEGLVADMSGNWTEGVMSNVFYQLRPDEATWYTPPIDAAGVKGVMRQVIIDQLAVQGRPVVERALRDEDLSAISAMFFCNAVRGVIPVRELIVADQRLALSTSIYSISG